MQETRVHVRCADAARAQALLGALRPETEDGLGGVQVRVDATDDLSAFELVVSAGRLPVLRAATNSLLKRLKAADAALDAVH